MDSEAGNRAPFDKLDKSCRDSVTTKFINHPNSIQIQSFNQFTTKNDCF